MDQDKDLLANLPEAPESAHVDAYLDGFHWGFTKRTTLAKMKPYIDEAVGITAYLREMGFKPSWNEDTNGAHAKGSTPSLKRTCPICGSPVKEGETKNGKKYVKCSTNKWNAVLQKPEGCEFIEWLE